MKHIPKKYNNCYFFCEKSTKFITLYNLYQYLLSELCLTLFDNEIVVYGMHIKQFVTRLMLIKNSLFFNFVLETKDSESLFFFSSDKTLDSNNGKTISDLS